MEKYVHTTSKASRNRRKKRFASVFLGVILIGALIIGIPATRRHESPGSSTSAIRQPQMPESHNSRYQYYVSPAGSDTNSGLSAQSPFRTVQHALDIVKPDTTIHLAPGSYREKLTTKTAGKADKPIVLQGDDVAADPSKAHQTVLFGSSRIINVNHSYYSFSGFAVDGQEKLSDNPYSTDPTVMNAYKDRFQSLIKDGRLIYVGSADSAQNITGIQISNMLLQGAGGECLRFRNNSFGDSVTNSVIRYCGLYAKGNSDDRFLYHNGEGVYIGTSPKSSDQPASQNDASHDILIADNLIETYGSECVDIKENAHHNTVRHNVCRYNLEPLEYDGSNVEIRGDHNSLLNNTVENSAGWNLKLVSDSSKYDKGGNAIQRNSFSLAQGSVNVYSKQNDAKLNVCGNSLDGTVTGIDKTVFRRTCK